MEGVAVADVQVDIKFNSAGFQQVLNSGAVKSMLVAEGGRVVSRCGGLAHCRAFTATGFGHGPRPAVSVFTHAKNRVEAAVARKVLGSAL
jgi:hypothetical protein